MFVEQWMRKNASDENCLMVVEDNDQARSTIRNLQNYNQDQWRAISEPKHFEHFPLKKIQEDPLFQAKKRSNPLILADFAAYVFKKVAVGTSATVNIMNRFAN